MGLTWCRDLNVQGLGGQLGDDLLGLQRLQTLWVAFLDLH